MVVCLRTASMEGTVPGKYGPHGELFFLPYSEGAVDGAQAVAPSSRLTSVRPSSLLMSLRSARLSPVIAEGRGEEVGCAPWSGRRMENGLPKESFGRVKTNCGRKTKVRLPVALGLVGILLFNCWL